MTIDLDARRLDVALDEAQLQAAAADQGSAAAGPSSGWLQQYRRNVGPLSQGAVLVQAQEPVRPALAPCGEPIRRSPFRYPCPTWRRQVDRAAVRAEMQRRTILGGLRPSPQCWRPLAASWGRKPIRQLVRLIVGFTSGGGADAITRIMAEGSVAAAGPAGGGREPAGCRWRAGGASR